MKQKILFVDDDANVLSGLKRLLRGHRDEWEMEFMTSGEEALAKLAVEPFHIIVSDLRMPKMSGLELLDKVREIYPDMVRFILSGHGDSDMLIQSVGVAHQFMAKPCDADLFKDLIVRATRLQGLFESDQIKKVIKDGRSLPTLPELYQELTDALQSPHSTANAISSIISRDVSISAKVLQLVNSAFFGLSRNIDSVSQAVALLGAETINSIVLVTQVFGTFSEKQVEAFGIREIYSHSNAVGASASRLTKFVTKSRKLADEAMLAGMVHELGKLVLINSDNEAWKQLYRDRHSLSQPFHEAERELLGTTYAEIGAYLIGLWGLSNNVVEAVAYHPHPAAASKIDQFNSLTALYLANTFDTHHRQHSGRANKVEFDMGYLESVGVVDQLGEFAKICVIEEDEETRC